MCQFYRSSCSKYLISGFQHFVGFKFKVMMPMAPTQLIPLLRQQKQSIVMVFVLTNSLSNRSKFFYFDKYIVNYIIRLHGFVRVNSYTEDTYRFQSKICVNMHKNLFNSNTSHQKSYFINKKMNLYEKETHVNTQ